jgi:Lrp/AsnC family leucine-responsive transcriptional regulator
MSIVTLLDDFDLAILRELSADGRVSFRELARRIGLSTPAVTDRVRKLRARGTITGFRAVINTRHLGVTMEVSIALQVAGPRLQDVAEKVGKLPEIVRCRRLTGDACFLIDAAVTSTEHLTSLIDQLAVMGTTSTSLVISTPVAERLALVAPSSGIGASRSPRRKRAVMAPAERRPAMKVGSRRRGRRAHHERDVA